MRLCIKNGDLGYMGGIINLSVKEELYVCSQNVHFMFAECSLVFEYTINKESCGFLHHSMSPVTVLTGR